MSFEVWKPTVTIGGFTTKYMTVYLVVRARYYLPVCLWCFTDLPLLAIILPDEKHVGR